LLTTATSVYSSVLARGSIYAIARYILSPTRPSVCLGTDGSVTLVLLPLKYEIDDSVTVTVVLLEGGGALLYDVIMCGS